MAGTYLVKDTYATITLAIAAIPADLSSSPGVHEVIIEKDTYNETISITGFSNASSSDYIYIHAKNGDEHKGIFGTGVIVDGIFIETQYNKFKDIEVVADGNTGIDLTHINAGFNEFENILVKILTADLGFYSDDVTDSNYIYKCVFWDPNNLGTQGTGTGGSIETIIAKNCVCYGFNYGFGGKIETTNCVAMAGRTQDYGNVPIGTSDYNASSDNKAPGTTVIHNLTAGQAAFKNVGTGDFHINLGSILKGAGTEQSSTFLKDIDSQAIDTNDWPIGIDYPVQTCWTYTARYKNSKRLYRVGGPDVYPSKLRVPSNVDISSGQMIDEGELIDPSKYIITN